MPVITEFDILTAAYIRTIVEEGFMTNAMYVEIKEAFNGVREQVLQCKPGEYTNAFAKLDNILFDKFPRPHPLRLSLQHCAIILYKHGGKLHNPLCKGECLGDTRVFISDTIIELSYYLWKKGLLTDSLRKEASRIKRDTAYLSGVSVSATRSRLLRFMGIHKLTNVRSWDNETGPTLFEQLKSLPVESDTPTTGVEFEARVLIDELTLLLIEIDCLTVKLDGVFDQAELYFGLGQPEEVIEIINEMIGKRFDRGTSVYYNIDYLMCILYEHGGKLHSKDCTGNCKRFEVDGTVAKFFHIVNKKGLTGIVKRLAKIVNLTDDEIMTRLWEMCDIYFPESSSCYDEIRAVLNDSGYKAAV